MKPLAMIAAVARDRALGSAGKLPWHIPEDLRRFKALTLGHPIIMGRRTFASLSRPLPGRTNIVLSRTAEARDGWVIVRSLAAALEHAKGDPLPFIIGGGEIYALALPQVTKLYLTDVALTVEGADAWFPELNLAEWREVSREKGEDARVTYRELERRP